MARFFAVFMPKFYHEPNWESTKGVSFVTLQIHIEEVFRIGLKAVVHIPDVTCVMETEGLKEAMCLCESGIRPEFDSLKSTVFCPVDCPLH